MEAVWGAVLSFLFVLATLSGYGAGTPPGKSEKDKSEQSDKKDEDKKDESDKSSNKEKSGKPDKKDKSGQKDKGSSAKPSKKKAEYCIKDCPEAWRIRP
jgi:hypothetical protein